MVARLAIGALIAASVALLTFELNRWRDPGYREALSSAQKTRRVAGALLLVVVLGMAYGGTFFPSHHARYGPAALSRREQLGAALQMLYWLLCLLFAVFLPVVAYLEAKTSLLKFASERREAKAEATAGMEDLIRRSVANSPVSSNGADKKSPPAP